MVRTYQEAGVDIDLQEASIAALVARLRYRRRGRGGAIPLPGFYAGLVALGRHALAISTDNVGTKLLVARALDRWEPVGVDCVAVNVNDVLCVGAEPLALVDYIAAERYDPAVAARIGEGLNRGAREARISVVGGEFACVPDIVRGYDLSGTCVGVVDRRRIVDGRAVRPGDVILGLPSSGLHCNGFTLVRRLLEVKGVDLDERLPGGRGTVGDALLEPTRIYVRQVGAMLRVGGVHGLAHISGGGLWNLLRLGAGVGFRIDDPLPVPPVFRFLQELGGIEAQEMYQTFNMGMGFAVVAAVDRVAALRRACREALPVGRVVRGRGVTLPGLGVKYRPEGRGKL